MNSERFQLVKAIVTDASEEESLSQRAKVVAQRCGGDQALLREVEALLGETTGAMEDYALHASGALRRDSTPLAAGRRFGAYAIVRELGRGGMGAVYLAARADQEFQKEVAIKLLKRGTDTDEVLRRFRAEREILARLEHPNIARLIDGGTTEDGLPYFVMEYVAGLTVTDFCASKAMALEERLRLFLKICAAVQFAHQHLIVHRDLKPANILVTSDREPKLLDFGISKLLASDGSGALSLTVADQQRLTPAYASPEQVRGEPITTVSDVYALGALLYEMVTGKNAHRFINLPPSRTEMLRVIGDEAPTRPSVAASDPATARTLRGDLDNILLQALRKEPARRYTGVDAMAQDVRRYLDGFPISARKDTVGYRASKFVRRNRLAVAAVVLLLLALLGGLGATAWEAHVAQIERAKAVERFNQVRELAHSVLFDYHDAIAALPGSTAVRQRLVQDALKYLNNLANGAGHDPDLLRELADAYDKVAAVQGGAASASGGLLSASNLGDTQGALASYGKALALREQVAHREPGNKEDTQALATAYGRLGTTYLFAGPPEKAIEYQRKAAAIIESLLANDPANESLLHQVATLYNGIARALGNPGVPNLGDTKGSLEYTQKALAVRERLVADHAANVIYQQALANLHNSLGLLYSATGERKKQLEEYTKALDLDQKLATADPANTLYQRELAVQLGNVSSTLVQLKDLPASLEYSRQALTIYEALAAADPSDVSLRRNLAVGYRNVAISLGTADKAAASGNFLKATQLLSELVVKDPKNEDFRKQWAVVYLATSRFESENNDTDGAVASAFEGIKITDALVAASPTNAGAQNTLAQLYSQLGAAQAAWASKPEIPKEQQTEHWQRAKEADEKGLALYEAMKKKGILPGGDANKPDELRREISRCDAALRTFSGEPAGANGGGVPSSKCGYAAAVRDIAPGKSA